MHQPPMPGQTPGRQRGNGRRLALWIGGAAVILFGLLVVAGALLPPLPEDGQTAPAAASSSAAPASPSPATSSPAPPPSPTARSSTPAPPSPAPSSSKPLPTAQQVADRLSGLYPLPNPRDNTGFCREIGCRQLITTDAVSIYQWRDVALAKRWAGDSEDKDRVGPYVLSYVGSEQQFTSKEARADMAAEVRKMLAER